MRTDHQAVNAVVVELSKVARPCYTRAVNPEIHCGCGTGIRLGNPGFSGAVLCPICGFTHIVAAPGEPGASLTRKPPLQAPAPGDGDPQRFQDTVLLPPPGTSSDEAGVETRTPATSAPTLPVETAEREKHRATRRVGRRFGHFELHTLLGKGGMGTVYGALDHSLQRLVALKVLAPKFGQDEDAVARFLREARSAAALTHPNLCHIYFIGEEAGEHFFAMEHIDGETIEALLDRQGRLSWQRALDIVLQVARGLQAAAQKNIIHRDIKPGNIMRRRDGLVKITDFGLSKEIASEQSLTQSGTTVGTPLYMSPEQGLGEPLDVRADMYSLGATFYHMVTGRTPFAGQTPLQVMLQHSSRRLTPVREIAPELPAPMAAIIEKLLAKRREDRFSDYDALIRALERCRPRPMPAAGLFVRLAASLFDLLVLGGFTLFSLWTLSALLITWQGGAPEFDSVRHYPLAEHYHLVLGTLLACYEAGALSRFGRTLGKLLFDLEVISFRGPALLSHGRIVERALLKWGWVILMDAWDEVRAPFQAVFLILAGLLGALNLGIFYVALSRQRLSLLDSLTRLRVVYRYQAEDDPDDRG